MNIIAVDDEIHALEVLLDSIQEVMPQANTQGFRKPEEAIRFLEKEPCEIAFLDIAMRGTNGIELAKRLKKLKPELNIIFVTGFSDYMQEAFSLYASGYVMKPATPGRIRKELENLRHPVLQESRKRVRICTFGNFEIFVDRIPIKFQYSKTKELMAYLVDRKGALCTNGEIQAVLWGDEESTSSRKSYISNLRADLSATLGSLACDNIIVKQRGSLAILPDEIDCDYLDWVAGKNGSLESYHGEYMTQYSWAEFTLAEIEAKK